MQTRAILCNSHPSKNAPDRTWPGTKEAHNPMMISTKGRYALRMLVDMAEHERGGGYVPLKEIAARQEISENIWKASSSCSCRTTCSSACAARAAVIA